MTTSHTPGPWLQMGKSVGVVQGELATVWDIDGRTHANARLIAAAPELKEAVERLLSWERTGHQTRSEDIAFAQRALAKANGGAA